MRLSVYLRERVYTCVRAHGSVWVRSCRFEVLNVISQGTSQSRMPVVHPVLIRPSVPSSTVSPLLPCFRGHSKKGERAPVYRKIPG